MLAQEIIRLKRDGKTVVSESATFDRRQLANEWMRRREAELVGRLRPRRHR